MNSKPSVVLENGLDLREVVTTGSILHISEYYAEEEVTGDFENKTEKYVDFIGRPVKCFADLEKEITPLDDTGYVKKKILESGGGFPLNKGNTVHIAYSGYFENEPEPFDTKRLDKPLIIDLNDNGLLPGLQMAVETMLVGETSLFLLTYQVMYGELGIKPKIKPKATCAFYIKLIKSIITPKEKLDISEPHSFQKLYHEVRMLFASGTSLYKCRNYTAAIQLFRKAVFMLHRARLADEADEQKQEKMLKRLFTNLAICYNATKQPLKACIACNEMNRLNNLWNNGKVLLQNAKALRMIGAFDAAEKKIKRAMKLTPDREELQKEYDLIQRLRNQCDQSKLVMECPSLEAREEFKNEVDNLIKNFKENMDLCKLTLPGTLSTAEIDYIKEVCAQENLFCKKIQKEYALDREGASEESDNVFEATFSTESLLEPSPSEPE